MTFWLGHGLGRYADGEIQVNVDYKLRSASGHQEYPIHFATAQLEGTPTLTGLPYYDEEVSNYKSGPDGFVFPSWASTTGETVTLVLTGHYSFDHQTVPYTADITFVSP